MIIDIDDVWNRIHARAGEWFQQIQGKEFTYTVTDRTAYLDGRPLFSKAEVAKALPFLPLRVTTKIQHLRAPSYLFAILMDERIRQGEW